MGGSPVFSEEKRKIQKIRYASKTRWKRRKGGPPPPPPWPSAAY
jgi:hypothetical protein